MKLHEDTQRIDSFEAIKPDEKLIELSAKILEQNRVILNTNYQMWAYFTQLICAYSKYQEEK